MGLASWNRNQTTFSVYLWNLTNLIKYTYAISFQKQTIVFDILFLIIRKILRRFTHSRNLQWNWQKRNTLFVKKKAWHSWQLFVDYTNSGYASESILESWEIYTYLDLVGLSWPMNQGRLRGIVSRTLNYFSGKVSCYYTSNLLESVCMYIWCKCLSFDFRPNLDAKIGKIRFNMKIWTIRWTNDREFKKVNWHFEKKVSLTFLR